MFWLTSLLKFSYEKDNDTFIVSCNFLSCLACHLEVGCMLQRVTEYLKLTGPGRPCSKIFHYIHEEGEEAQREKKTP
jgi:hypothetical protein